MLIIIVIILCITDCSKKLPDKALQICEDFFTLRQHSNYSMMYAFYTESHKKKISFQYFEYLENLYTKKLGTLERYNLKKWAYRKNFSFGPDSGTMVKITFDCEYESGVTEETFALLNIEKNIWKIFDYYLKPVKIKQLTLRF